MQELNGRISDKDDGLALTMCFLRKAKDERKGVGFYRRGAWKTKRRFDPRYKRIDRRHVSYAINASGQLVRILYT